ncbi:MAG: peroxiredoxin [Candidatus Thiodiazotropha sp. 6PLUC2]
MKLGDMAAEFILHDQTGKAHSLKDYRGRWVVLYFYPKDDTPGCRTEACAFRDQRSVFEGLEVVVLGVSTDDQRSHQRFAEKFELGFPILSDVEGRVAQSYGSLFRLWPFIFAKRQTFIIDPAGKIAAIYRKVDAKNHSLHIVEELQRVMQK